MRIGEQLLNVAWRHWLCEQEALHRRTAVRTQFHQLGGLFDPFRRGFDAQRLRELRDRANDRRRAVPSQQILDEAAVDLELVERKALKIAELRIAGTEIVERDADSKRS